MGRPSSIAIVIVSVLISSCGLSGETTVNPLPSTDTAPEAFLLPVEWTPTPLRTSVPVQAMSSQEAPSVAAPESTPTGDVSSSQPRLFLDALQMWSATEGWGRTSRMSEGSPRVLHTLDGGSTWTDVTPPGVPQGPQVSGDLASLGKDVAWLSVAVYPEDRSGPIPAVVTVYQTVDGGAHWSQGAAFELEHGIAEMPVFIDTLHGWMLPWFGEGGSREARDLRKTVDGGRTWEVVSTWEDSDGIPLGCTKTGLAFADEDVGWLTGICPGPFFLYTTADGGATWSQVQSLALPEGIAGDAWDLFNGSVYVPSSNPTFFANKAGYLWVTLETGNGPTYNLLYTTRDAGATWTPNLLPDEMFSPTLVNPDEGWGLSGSRHDKLSVTINGGKDWEYVGLVPRGSCLPGPLVNFVDPQHGWCLDCDILYSTGDGGRTWQRLEPSIATNASE